MKKTMKKSKNSAVAKKLDRGFTDTVSRGKQTPPGFKHRSVTTIEQGGDDLTSVLLETAAGMYKTSLMDKTGYEKITMRHLKTRKPALAISGVQIRKMRESANMSQSVFANVLNLTPGYISAMERGDKKPSGSTLAMLDLIKRKGINSVLD